MPVGILLNNRHHKPPTNSYPQWAFLPVIYPHQTHTDDTHDLEIASEVCRDGEHRHIFKVFHLIRSLPSPRQSYFPDTLLLETDLHRATSYNNLDNPLL